MIIYAHFLVRKGYLAFAFWPFIVVKRKAKVNAVLLNHERIHLRQQLELLVLPFYLLYFTEYLIRRLQYPSWRAAYENISFEREAFAHEGDMGYLEKRRFWGWAKYVK